MQSAPQRAHRGPADLASPARLGARVGLAHIPSLGPNNSLETIKGLNLISPPIFLLHSNVGQGKHHLAISLKIPTFISFEFHDLCL